MLIFSTIKGELIKLLYNINLQRLPSQNGEVSVMLNVTIRKIRTECKDVYKGMQGVQTSQIISKSCPFSSESD